MSDYWELCEDLFRDCLAGAFVPAPGLAKWLRFDAIPEPYLVFGDASRPLYFLTTNPGGVLDFQRLDEVAAGRSLINPRDAYRETAARLAEHYERTLQGTAAGRRINGVREIATAMGCTGVVQLELVPFHSASLPGKRALLGHLRGDPFMQRYAELLRAECARRPLLVLSCVGSHRSIAPTTITDDPWNCWLAELAGFGGAPSRDDLHALALRGDKTTAAAWAPRAGSSSRAWVLMTGSNGLPGESGRTRVAELLKETEP